MVRQNRIGSLIIAILVTIIAVGLASSASAQNYSACGTLYQGLDCIYFRPFSGGQYLIQNWGSFHIGDTVHITHGTIALEWCFFFQEYAINGNGIEAGATACSWYYPCCQGTTGNLAGNTSISLIDLARLVSYLTGGVNAIQCRGEADIDASGAIDLADLASLVIYLTGGGYQFPACRAGS